MRTDRLLLQDILEAIDEVIEATPSTRELYHSNKYLRSHIIRNIQIIGEAAARLSQNIQDGSPGIPWRLIIGMRHIIVHDYFGVDWEAVFDTASRDVPALRALIMEILERLSLEDHP